MTEQHYQALLLKAQQENFLEWVYQNKIVNERNDPIEFRNHYFLYDIYNDWTPKQAIVKCAQIGFSTMAILKTLYAAYYRKLNVIYTLPTAGDVGQFVPEKVNRIISSNPAISSWVQNKDSIEQKRVGERFIYYRGTMTEKAALMFSSDLNVYDEEDRSDATIISQYASRLDYSTYKGEWHFSNPSYPNAGTHAFWKDSDQKHWFIKCSRCNHRQYMEWEKNVDPAKGVYVCQKCHKPLSDEDRRVGEWVRKWQDKDISGYWINQMMAPWKSCGELLELEATKSKQYFYNFVLGLPYAGSDVAVDRDLILKNRSTIEPDKKQVCMGVDVGLEKHVVIGTPDCIFKVYKTRDWDVIERDLLKYDAVMVVDALPDITKPRELVQKYKGRVFINYFKDIPRSKDPVEFKRDNEYGVVVSDRTRVIEQGVDMLAKEQTRYFMDVDSLDEYVEHWGSMYRYEDKDGKGNDVVRWESANDVDHFAFAHVYYLVARERVSSRGGTVFLEESKKIHGTPSFYVENGGISAPDLKEFIGEPERDWRYT